jgi:hypothetical protein
MPLRKSNGDLLAAIVLFVGCFVAAWLPSLPTLASLPCRSIRGRHPQTVPSVSTFLAAAPQNSSVLNARIKTRGCSGMVLKDNSTKMYPEALISWEPDWRDRPNFYLMPGVGQEYDTYERCLISHPEGLVLSDPAGSRRTSRTRGCNVNKGEERVAPGMTAEDPRRCSAHLGLGNRHKPNPV